MVRILFSKHFFAISSEALRGRESMIITRKFFLFSYLASLKASRIRSDLQHGEKEFSIHSIGKNTIVIANLARNHLGNITEIVGELLRHRERKEEDTSR